MNEIGDASDHNSDRRKLLISAAMGTLLPSATAEAAPFTVAQAAPAPQSTSGPAAAFRVPTMTAQSERTAWQTLIAQLKSYGAWPATFDTSLEKGVVPALKAIAQAEMSAGANPSKLTHNPRLVEPLLGEISVLLDRCLAYRREAADLEIQGIAGGIARVQSDALKQLDEKLLKASPTRDVAALVVQNYPEAFRQFNRSINWTDKAWAVKTTTDIAGNTKIRDAEDARLTLAAQRLKLVYEFERSRLTCQDVLGNAYNFGQRHDRVRKLFESDMQSAYRRAIAAGFGLSGIFGYTDPKYTSAPWIPDPSTFPNPDAGDFLDDFVIWTRNAMRAVSLIGETEVEYTEQVFIKFGTNPQDVDLSPIFTRIKSPRLRAVGASFILKKQALSEPDKAQASFRLVMTRKAAEFGPQTVLFVPSVRALGTPNQGELFESALLYNADPRGTWATQLSGKGGTVGPTISVEGKDWIDGVVLYLRVVGTIDTAASGPSLTDTLLRN